MLHYKTLLGSMYNTPPCWSIYMAGLVFAKLLDEGGLDAVRQRNEAKAKVLTCLRGSASCLPSLADDDDVMNGLAHQVTLCQTPIRAQCGCT